MLEENQKVSISQLVRVHAIASVLSSLELEALGDIFYSALGKGIVCFTNDNQPAYVPLKNLRSTQGGAISIVSAYDPEVEFILHSRLSPKSMPIMFSVVGEIASSSFTGKEINNNCAEVGF